MIEIAVVVPIGVVDADLSEQFRALSSQTFDRKWELVLSLNAPGEAEALAQALPAFSADVPVSVVDSSAVRSAAHARNAGAAAARAERIAFCDADDIVDQDWLDSMNRALDHHRAVGGFLDERRLAVAGQSNWRPPATPGGNPSFLGHEYLVSANMAIWAEDFHQAGGFDETLLRCEDIALSWSLLRRGVGLGFAPGAVVHYRHRKGLWPMLKQHYLYGQGMSQLLARFGTPDGVNATLRPNGQSVERMSAVHILRRGSIAAGRLVGLLQEYPRSVRSRRTRRRLLYSGETPWNSRSSSQR